MNIEAIKLVVNQPAWEEVEKLISDEILAKNSPLKFNTEGKTPEMIAVEVMAREMSAKIINEVLTRLKTIASGKEYKKENWE